MMTIGRHLVIISKLCPWSSFDDHDGHGCWYGHHFQNGEHGPYFLNHFMQLGRPCTKTGWWPWSSFSEWQPWLPYQNNHGKIEDDHEMMTTKNDDHGWWLWPKNASLTNLWTKTENGNKNLPSGNSSKHSTTGFPHFAVQRKRRLCTCLPEYLKRHWQAFFLPYTDFEILSLWEFGSHRLGLTRTFFFKKSSLWLSPNLSSKSSSVWLALFLYHVDHPNKHHQKIRLTEQISKSPLVLIAGIYWWPNRLPMLETSAKVTGQPWCALILPPSQLPQSRNAISQWRPRLCQWRPRLRSRKKNENTFGHRKNVEKKMKIRLGIEKTSKKNEKKRKTHIKNTKKKRKKNEKNSRFFLRFFDFSKIG